MDLSEIRINIDRLDREMRQLFLERMGLSEQVVSVKAETGDSIYKPDREKEILSRKFEGMSEEMQMDYKAFMKRVMEISRKYQYGRLLEMKKDFPYDLSDVKADHNRCKIEITCSKNPNLLGGFLTMISDYGISVKNIESDQMVFTIELEGNLLKKEMQCLIYQLANEADKLLLLDSYKFEGDS